MNGKTYKIRRRLSIVALAASIAAVAIPAASAGGKYFGPGSNRVEKQGPYGGYWVQQIRVLGPGPNTVEKRGPYGAYWVRKNGRSKNTHVSSDSRLNEPSMCAVHLYPCGATGESLPSKDNGVSLDPGINDSSMCEFHLDPCGRSVGSLEKPGSNLGSEVFPRADDLMFSEILQGAALEHGASGFGNATQVTQVSWKPMVVDYAHLPGEDRP